ncbi:spore germination protein [Bacillaceae bacterium SIJ1]|uniref:spore germination protein n=1 Tax=Litoribacterium kuwaitense TaxID=1398745 RepID=UPI0013E9B9CF|nr:spore germination protein [Litoribacterium kuwaitense]NGP45078.1 spore germination protein [Litoribacterium kuwaitense]
MGKTTKTREEFIKHLFRNSSDVVVEIHDIFNESKINEMLVIYCQGLADTKMLMDSILPDIQTNYYYHGLKSMRSISPSEKVFSQTDDMEQVLTEKVFNGFTAIIIAEYIYFFNTANPPKRNPEESNSEVSVRGPRDAFVEDIQSNFALVRKRVKSNSLVTKSFVIGKRSRTQVQLVYLSDIQDEKLIDDVTERLNQIDIDFLSSDNQLLGLLGHSHYSLFPLLESVSRPDGVVTSLSRGRFAIFIDNVPNVIVAPSNLSLFLKTSEDEYTPFYYATFEILLRLTGLLISLFLPAAWVALTSYNVDQIPFQMLATIASSRIGIPFNSTIEILIMLGLFELFREAGVRLPKPVGQTVAVVGGLIVGDAAIRAGLTSPTMLVITAITVVATFTLGNQALFGTVSIIRVVSLLFASVLGMFGFLISVFLTLGYLAKLESFGIPYLSPVSPFVRADFVKAFTKPPVVKQNKRAAILHPKDGDRQGEE